MVCLVSVQTSCGPAGCSVPLTVSILSGKNCVFMNQAKLFVGNISYQTTEEDLRDHFAQAGTITAVNLMLDKYSGKSRGFAFVEYTSAQDAAKAVEMFNQKELQGRALTVNIARPREERPPYAGRPSESRGDS